jgi:hypothetical protein
MSSPLVPTSQVDYLEQDPPLRGQNFVCLSFISPEDVIKKKEVYFFEEFMKHVSSDMTEFFANLKEKYPDDAGTLNTIKERYAYLFTRDSVQNEYDFFVSTNSVTLEEEYHKNNDFQTSLRGIKVRGVFDSLREAEIRAQVLKKMDDKFNVYVAQVGCWCPWSPNPEEITNQEYAETHLNTMMKQYKDNSDKKDMFYQERKRDLQATPPKKIIEEDVDPWLASKEPVVTVEETTATAEPVEEITTTPEEPDASTASPEVTPPELEVPPPPSYKEAVDSS